MDIDVYQLEAHDGHVVVRIRPTAEDLRTKAARVQLLVRAYAAAEAEARAQARAAAIALLGEVLFAISELAGGLGVSLAEVARRSLLARRAVKGRVA